MINSNSRRYRVNNTRHNNSKSIAYTEENNIKC